MSTYTLGNTSAEIDCVLSESYSRLTGNFAGPLNASIISNSGFLIQNGNKQTGLFVGNSSFIFGRNILDFTQYCEDVLFNIPQSCNFLICGTNQKQILNFKSNGTLSIGANADPNRLGLQVSNSFPEIILKDTYTGSQNQSISFRDRFNNFFTCIWNNSSALVNSNITEATQISYNKALIFNEFGSSAKTFLSGNYLSFGFESCLNTGYNFSVNGSGYFSCGLYSPSIITDGNFSVGFDSLNTDYDLSVSGSGYFSCSIHSKNVTACNYLSVGFTCLNTGYNLSVSGSAYISSSLCSSTIVASNYLVVGFDSLNTGYNLSVSGSGCFSRGLYSPEIIACDYLSVGFASLNTGYNLSVSGSAYISSDLNIGGNYLSVGFPSLNTGYNLSVSGSGYFSSDLCASNINVKTGYFCSNDLFLKGSGGCSSLNICNQLDSGLGVINFYNSSGAVYNKITSNQEVQNGGSELNFYITSTGAYDLIDRSELALKICNNKSINFYGDILSQAGQFNCSLSANEFTNSGSKTFLNTGILGSHCLLLNNSTYIYSYCSISGFVTDHIWYTSGNNPAARINRLGNFTTTGSIFSHSGICSTGSLCINNLQLNSCIISKCVILSGNGSLCNINLFGNVQTCGSFENTSSTQAKFFGICSTGNGDNLISGNLISCNLICSTGGIRSCGCIQSSSCGVFNQGVVSNSWICAQNSGVFGSVVCALGTTNTNCFCSSVNVCGSVNATNTAKAWGIYGLNNSSTPTLTGLNIKSINIYQNATPLIYAYGICFNNPITYPFVINFNVYSSGNALITGNNSNLQNGEPLGFSGVTSIATHLGSSSATVNYPFSVQFYALSGKRSSDNTLVEYSAGTSYSEIYFNLANQDGPTTNYADLTRTNAHGIIHFSILGQ